jgi:hypothetical protein
MLDYSRYVLKFSDVLRKKRKKKSKKSQAEMECGLANADKASSGHKD